jgi:hypothetical protein
MVAPGAAPVVNAYSREMTGVREQNSSASNHGDLHRATLDALRTLGVQTRAVPREGAVLQIGPDRATRHMQPLLEYRPRFQILGRFDRLRVRLVGVDAVVASREET